MPTFCRHNHLIQNCPICAREQAVELRPIVSSGAPRSSQPPTSSSRPPRARTTASRSGAGSRTGVRVRRLARGADDGYHTRLAPGLRSTADAERLAEELAFAAHRLTRLEQDPPGLYAEVAQGQADLEERTWLAFQIEYLCPVDGEAPFASIEAARSTWQSGQPPELDGIELGPRTAHDPSRGTRTLDAYRAWTGRAGSQAAAFSGKAEWTPERRFARLFERLALPGLHRDARFALLVALGRLGVYELRAGTLALGGANEVTVAAKRVFGIGDPLLLQRRAGELAQECGLAIETLDVGLCNWGRGDRATLGLGRDREPDPEPLETARRALGL